MNETLSMILRMSGVTALYIALTWLVWRFWRKKERHTLIEKIAVGLLYGLCSVLSTHFGVNYEAMVLNVRDLGPLAAGLFFDPLSGILSGLIGGIERFIAGEFWGVGSFTRIACSVSTCLAGFLAAFLNWKAYRGKRPPVPHALFLGAVMEVFHMYVALITHRAEMAMAYYVVRVCALPMIIFSALGLAGCSWMILVASGEKIKPVFLPEEQTPIEVRFQRWLLLVTSVIFIGNFTFSYLAQHSMARQTADAQLRTILYNHRRSYTESRDIRKNLDLLQYQMYSELDEFLLLDRENNVILSGVSEYMEANPSEKDIALIRSRDYNSSFTAEFDYFSAVELFCAVGPIGNEYLLMVAKSTENIYWDLQNWVYEEALANILLFTAIYMAIAILARRLVGAKLSKVVEALQRITDGNLNEKVNVRSSVEFAELSDDINKTVEALKGYIQAAEKQMEEEMKLASTIQESALPRVFLFPRRDFEIHALMDPAKQVGGDFYDFFFVDPNLLAMVIADVSGKGVPAALFMMRAKTAIKNQARSGSSPAEIFAVVNNTLCEGNDAEMFVTAWIGIIDLRDGQMHCANAGHEYPALLRAGGEYELIRDKHALALAAMEDVPMREYELQLHPGDRLFVYTDGVPEAINEQQEQYGSTRLVNALNRNRHESQEALLRGVREDIAAFVGQADQFDDITMIGFTYNGQDREGEQQA